MCDDGKIRTWTQKPPPPPREPRFRIEEMSLVELIRQGHTFHRRDPQDKSVIGGGNIHVRISRDEIVTPPMAFIAKRVISWFKPPSPQPPLKLRIVLDGCQSAVIHREDTVWVVTVSAHSKYGCGLTLSWCEYIVPSDITQIRVKEMLHE